MKNSLISNSVNETKALGEKLAKLLKPGDNIALTGNLGSGKTTFTKGLARGLKIEKPEYVNSPSFVLMKEYKGRANLYHFDLYRLDSLEDIEYIGMQEYLDGDGIVVIEWADRMKILLPSEYLEVSISITAEKKRKFTFIAHGKRYNDIVSRYIKS